MFDNNNIMATIPENFKSTVLDLTNDLSTTFPEYTHLWSNWSSLQDNDVQSLFDYCLTVFPERFFDILYQNNDIFQPESGVNTFFLPNIDFKLFFNCEGVSENTKKTLWKYLQLLLFTVVGSIKDKSGFGDTANIFDGIDEAELQNKLKETMSGINDFFNNMGINTNEANSDNNGEQTEFTFDKTSGIPNMDELHSHLQGLFDGKIGTLAKELAEEISGEFTNILGEEAGDASTTGDVLKKMMKNPKKMMDLVKKVGDKIKSKMDSGEISKDEIMKEAGDILQRMKEMGGGDQMNEILKKFAGGMGKNMKIDTNALNRMTKQEAMKQRLRNKLDSKKAAPSNYVLEQTTQPNNYVFRMPGEEGQQRSSAPPTDEELINMFESEKPAEPKKNSNKKKGKNNGKK